MDFKDFYKEELIVEGNGIAFIGNGNLFGYLLGKLNLKSMPVYLDENAKVILASRNAYQKLMDGFAISYKQYLDFKATDKPKKDYKDDKKSLFGSKETIQSKHNRSKFKKYASRFNKTFVKNAYKGILKQHAGQLGDYDEIVSVMVYTINNGGIVVFINTIEKDSDRYFISADEKADRFFLSNTGTSIAAYITKYGDRVYRSPKFFDNNKKYSNDDLLDIEDEEKDRKPKLDIGYHYDASKDVDPPKDPIFAAESDPFVYYVHITDSHDFNELVKQIDYKKTKKGVVPFRIHRVDNLKGQSDKGNRYIFKDGSMIKLYYDFDKRGYYMWFSGTKAFDNAIISGMLDFDTVTQDFRSDLVTVKK